MNEEVTSKKALWGNRIFYIVLILLILGSVGFTFWRIVIQKDYQIVAEVSCDPAIESCYHYEGTACDVTDATCTPEESYDYKMISKKAATIYTCEQTAEKLGCTEELSCIEGEADCTYTNCDTTNPEEAKTCAIEKGSIITDDFLLPVDPSDSKPQIQGTSTTSTTTPIL